MASYASFGGNFSGPPEQSWEADKETYAKFFGYMIDMVGGSVVLTPSELESILSDQFIIETWHEPITGNVTVAVERKKIQRPFETRDYRPQVYPSGPDDKESDHPS